MRTVSDDFLLGMAEISAGLVGLFLVGIFFFVETGFQRPNPARNQIEPYFRASTRIVLVLYAIPIGLSLTLVALDLVWSRVLFAVLSLLLIAANLETAIRIRTFARAMASPVLVANEALGTASVVVLVTLPWILGGLEPSREDLTWAVLLSFGVGFVSICATVLSAFDIARLSTEPEPTLVATAGQKRIRRHRVRPRNARRP